MKYLTIENDYYLDNDLEETLNSENAVMDAEFIKMLCSDPFRLSQIIKGNKNTG